MRLWKWLPNWAPKALRNTGCPRQARRRARGGVHGTAPGSGRTWGPGTPGERPAGGTGPKGSLWRLACPAQPDGDQEVRSDHLRYCPEPAILRHPSPLRSSKPLEALLSAPWCATPQGSPVARRIQLPIVARFVPSFSNTKLAPARPTVAPMDAKLISCGETLPKQPQPAFQ